jgi:hypothetical protein
MSPEVRNLTASITGESLRRRLDGFVGVAGLDFTFDEIRRQMEPLTPAKDSSSAGGLGLTQFYTFLVDANGIV